MPRSARRGRTREAAVHASGISVRASLLTVALGACVFAPAAPAGAAFPGTNGRIAFDRGTSGQFNVVSTRADGSGLTRLAANAAFPRYDAKGARIVYLSVSPGMSSGIRVMNSDGTNKHTVTTNANDSAPTWAPGGRQIAFVRGNTLMSIH